MKRAADGRHSFRAPRSRAAELLEASIPAVEHSPSWIIEHENLEGKIYTRLRGLIIDRSIPPGGRLVVDHLARKMGVSRTPVLGALKRLGLEVPTVPVTKAVCCLARRPARTHDAEIQGPSLRAA